MNKRDPEPNGYSFSVIFEAVMSLVYLGIAYILLFTDYFTVQKDLRLALGIILTLYGVFRIYRSVKKLKSENKKR